MRRLIDASVFEVVCFQGKSEEFCEGAKYILEMIDAQPTAYDMDKVKEEGYGKGVNDFAKAISPYISEYQKTIKQNRFAFIDVYGIAGRLVENYNNE